MKTDHKTLSKIFAEVKTELDEAENSLAKLCGTSDWSSSKYRRKNTFSSDKSFTSQKDSVKRSRESSLSLSSTSSEDELPSKKIAIRSAITTNVANTKSRKDVILKQNSNSKIQSRNRRILGLVQTTLQKFQDEAVKRQSQDLKRIKVELKVEAAEEEEKELIKKQKKELSSKQKEKQLQLKCLQEMMEFTESFEIWESNQRHMLNYIMTKAEPKICFLPASHTPKTEKSLKKSQLNIQEIMLKQRKVMESELSKISESYQLEIPIAEVSISSPQKDNHNNFKSVVHSVNIEQKYYRDRTNLQISDDELMFSE